MRAARRVGAQCRSLVLLARPPVLLLLVAYGALGLARAGAADRVGPALVTAGVVTGFLLYSVALNDIADRAVDQVNLPGRRPLSSGRLARHDLLVAGCLGGLGALALAFAAGPGCGLVLTAGLAVSTAYSLPPLRLAARGVVAPLVLPACYVVVPSAVGLLAGGGAETVDRGDLICLTGLYLGFIGRIVLKDFRDVRGDALFGKRTFLVRHGRVATCRFSTVAWTAGGALLAVTKRASPVMTIAVVAATVGALVLLALLSRARRPVDDERLVSALAVVGRSTLVLLVVAQVVAGRADGDLLLAALAVTFAGQAVVMARSGPPAPRVGRADRVLLDQAAAVAAVARQVSSQGVAVSPSSRSMAEESST